jgi:anti-sigma regulatory factor (Ser/Thr protein kinase)
MRDPDATDRDSAASSATPTAMADDGALLNLDLPDRAEAAAAARKALTALNGSLHLVSEARLRDAQLLVSELVANAVRHGGRSGEQVRVSVRANPKTMRVEVTDRGAGFEPERLPQPSSEHAGGWGLAIVAALAHRWGVERRTATTVWFEIDRPQRETPIESHPSPPQ